MVGTAPGRVVRRAATYVGAAVVLIVMAFPLYGIILTSTQTERDIRSADVAFVPTYITTEHYTGSSPPPPAFRSPSRWSTAWSWRSRPPW